MSNLDKAIEKLNKCEYLNEDEVF